MKKLLIFALALLLAPAVVFAAPAQYVAGAYFYSSHTGEADGAAGTYLAYGGAPPMSGTQAVVEFANLTSDLSSSRLYALVETGDETTVDEATTASNNTVPVAATASLSLTPAGAGSWVALYDPTTGYFEVDRISSGTAATNIVLVGTTDYAYTTATKVIELTTSGASALVANTTLSFTGGNILVGKVGEVLGWYLDGTSSCKIGALSGTYKR